MSEELIIHQCKICGPKLRVFFTASQLRLNSSLCMTCVANKNKLRAQGKGPGLTNPWGKRFLPERDAR